MSGECDKCGEHTLECHCKQCLNCGQSRKECICNAQYTPWISIKERLPEKNTLCLVSCGVRGILICEYDDNGNWCSFSHGCGFNQEFWMLQSVTAWISIPEIPNWMLLP